MEELETALSQKGLKVSTIPGKGRCLFTARDFSPGLTLAEDVPKQNEVTQVLIAYQKLTALYNRYWFTVYFQYFLYCNLCFLVTFAAGEVILSQEPYVSVPNKNSSDSSLKCDWCFTSTTLKKCSACQVVWYCSGSCQVPACVFGGFSINSVSEIRLRIFYIKMSSLCVKANAVYLYWFSIFNARK